MDSFAAQCKAVVATAQLATATDHDFDIRVVTQSLDGTLDWVVTVTWTDGPDLSTTERILEGPPPGVLLHRRAALPDLDRDER